MFHQRERRGFTLILMSFMLTILIGAAAFAVDFSRMSLYRTQLRSAADAAALAAAFRLSQGGGSASADTAVAYASKNTVGGTTPLVLADVLPGTWSDATKAFTQTSWAAGSYAVQVTTRYNASFGFAKIFGLTNRTITATAVAVAGGATSSSCVRPWAIPYQAMLDVLYSPGSKSAATYDLTTADIARLAVMTSASNPVTLKVGTGSNYTANGQFWAVQLPPGEYANGTAGSPWSGGSNYRTAIGDDCTALAALIGGASGNANPYVSVGDWLSPETGNKVGPTQQGVDDQCGSDVCSPARKLIAGMWDSYGNAPGGHCSGCYHIKYMAIFSLTGWDNANNAVTGYFNTTTSASGTGGTFVAGGASPIQVIALVK